MSTERDHWARFCVMWRVLRHVAAFVAKPRPVIAYELESFVAMLVEDSAKHAASLVIDWSLEDRRR